MPCSRGAPPTPASAGDLGALDGDAIERVRDEERPDPRDADELHDALLTAGFLDRRRARTACGRSCSRDLIGGAAAQARPPLATWRRRDA